MLCLLEVTEEEGHPLEEEDGLRGFGHIGGWIFESHIDDERHPVHGTILVFVEKSTSKRPLDYRQARI